MNDSSGLLADCYVVSEFFHNLTLPVTIFQLGSGVPPVAKGSLSVQRLRTEFLPDIIRLVQVSVTVFRQYAIDFPVFTCSMKNLKTPGLSTVLRVVPEAE